MKVRWLWVVMVANLLVLLALALVVPQLMVSPGPLLPGHAALASDCFACHAPLRGASAERCMACHALPDIGLRTTQGVAIQAVALAGAGRLKAAFHQALSEPDCMACHSDHAGPKLTPASRKRYSHDLLRVDLRQRCESCHAAPANALHRTLSVGCAQCHQLAAWKPATFAHDQHFVLDQNHKVACATCHTADDHSAYTCYGCHAHTPDQVRRQHQEEGIQNLENCVACHRSAAGEHEGRGSREGGGGKRGGRD